MIRFIKTYWKTLLFFMSLIASVIHKLLKKKQLLSSTSILIVANIYCRFFDLLTFAMDKNKNVKKDLFAKRSFFIQYWSIG